MGTVFLSNGALMDIPTAVSDLGDSAVKDYIKAQLGKSGPESINESDYYFNIDDDVLETMDATKAEAVHDQMVEENNKQIGEAEKWSSLS